MPIPTSPAASLATPSTSKPTSSANTSTATSPSATPPPPRHSPSPPSSIRAFNPPTQFRGRVASFEMECATVDHHHWPHVLGARYFVLPFIRVFSIDFFFVYG